MKRILKKPEERKNEILDCAEELFNSNGYEKTTTNEILKKSGIARGTLYYHFKSKEEILNEVINRFIDRRIDMMKNLIEAEKINALEKIERIVSFAAANSATEIEIIQTLHQEENIVMHHKSLVQSIIKMTPLISEILLQGINEGLFQTEYHYELTEFILTIMNFLFDPSIFPRTNEELFKRMKALENVLELSLKAAKGSFKFMSGLFLSDNV